MKRIAFFLTGLLLFSCWPTVNVWADDVSVAATVDRRTVELGDSLQFTITISNFQDVTPIQLPKMDGFDARYMGPATHVSIINGRYSSSTSLMYRLAPLKTGKLQIPALSMNLGSKDYKTEAIDIDVVDAGTIKSPASANPDSNQTGSVSLQDKLFVVMNLPKSEFYIGEPIPVTIKLFVNNVSVRNLQFPEFEHTGFTVDEFPQPQKYVQAIGGIEYQVVEFKTFAYPTRTGDLTIGPAKILCNVVFRSAHQQRPASGGFFDDEIFDNFFENLDVRAIPVESTDVKVKVLPLPEEGQPKNFSGGVGNFDFSMSIGPTEVKVGDPVTVRMKVAGQGNLKALTMPAIPDGANFKFYDPQVTDKPGEKSLEQVIIPKNDSVKEVPSVSFSYFDPQKQQYQTIARGPFSLSVKPLEKGEESKVIGVSSSPLAAEPKAETLGRDIIFIKEFPGTIRPLGFILTQNIFYWLFMLAVVGIWAGLYSHYRLTHRLKTDVRFAQKLQAPKEARSGLAQAKSYLEKGRSKEFYDVLFKTLQKYFSYKFHLASGAVNDVTVLNVMQTKKLQSATIIENIRSVFDECELVRYASVGVDPDKMQASYGKAEEIIDYFERNWR